MRLTILVCRSVFSTTLFIIGWIMAVLGFTPHGNGQSLVLSVKDPENAQVCQLSFTALQIRNTQSTSLQNLRVQLRLPDGIEYLPGSLINAGEFNITRLSEPWFQIDEIAPGDSLRLSIQCRFRCTLYEQINQGASFSNTWIVHSMLGMDSIRSAQPYVVQTPFLLIQNVTDSTAVLGASFQRTIRITNTRLGSLSRFTFEDRHDELEIHSNSGTTIQQTDQLLQLEFGPADFLQIGDRDSLFERDESVVITETIRHLSCLVEQVRSDFAAYWGCDGDQCQRYEEHATLNFIQPNQFAKLQFVNNTRYPECICSDLGAEQELIIRNTGGQTAENILLTLKATKLLNPTNPYGILRNSIRLEGAAVILDTQFVDQLALPGCKSSDGYAWVILKLSEIPAGEEVRLHFNFMTCLVCPPSNDKLPWYFSYAYRSKCIPFSEVSGMDLVAEIINPSKAFQAQISMTTTNGSIEDQQTYTIENKLNFNQPVSNQVLILEFDLPCPLRLTDSTFLLNGKAPFVRQITGDSSKHVYLEYAPPFPANLSQRFPVFVDCNYLCDQNGKEAYQTRFISSCPDSFQLPVSLPVKLCMKAQLSCPNREFDCGPCSGGEFLFDVRCSSISSRKDTVHSYWYGTAESYRYNYGFSDPDDNRLEDIGPLDTSITQKRRFITGDTIVHDFNLTLVSDLQDIEADSILLMVSSDLSYDTLMTEIEILDLNRNIRYRCFYPIRADHVESKPLPNCVTPVVSKSGFGTGVRIPLTPELLNQFGAGIPDGFRFEAGDQLKARVLARISSNVGGRIYKGVVTKRAFFINRKQVRLDPYSCLAEKDSIELASYGIQFDQSFNEILICHTTFDLFKCTFKGTRELANFFNREIRPMGQLDSLRILIDNDQLVIDSFQFRFYFDSSSNRKAIDSFWFPALKGTDYWYVDPALLEKLVYDESYTLELIPRARLLDCARFKNASNTIIAAYYVKGAGGVIFYEPPTQNIFYRNRIFSRANTLNIYNGNSQLSIANNTLYARTNRIDWSFLISNLKIPGGFEFEVHSRHNSLSRMTLESLPDGRVTQRDSFRFQVDQLDALKNYQLKFSSRFEDCRPDTIMVLIRWFCQGDSNRIQDLCNQDTIVLIAIPEMPELEMDLMQESKSVALCDTLPELELELYNADKGHAFNLTLELMLPPGMEWIPSTLLFRYPRNAAFQVLPLPEMIGPGLFRWRLSDFIPEIALNGLPGVADSLRNSIAFKMTWATNCGSLVNGFPVFEFNGTDYCGNPTNAVTKTGQRIRIQGIEPDAFMQIRLSTDFMQLCSDSLVLDFLVLKSQLTEMEDSIQILLPDGLQFTAHSFKPVRNIHNQIPIRVSDQGLEWIRLGLTPGINALDSILFSLTISGIKRSGCTENRILVNGFTRFKAWCSTTQMDCDIKVESGSDDLFIPAFTGRLILDSFRIQADSDSLLEHIYFDFILEQKDKIPDSTIWLAVIEDLNADGKWDAMDVKILEIPIHLAQYPKDGRYPFDSIVTALQLPACHYLLVSLPGNCLCHADTLSFSRSLLRRFHLQDSICAGASVWIGRTFENGKQYRWTSGPVDCDTCSLIRFATDSGWTRDSVFHFILEESDHSRCRKIFEISLQVFKNPEGRYQLLESCPEEWISVDAGSRKNYSWTGDGISDPSAYVQRVYNDHPRRLYLHFRDEKQCPSIDTFDILPLKDSTQILVIGDTTTNPGVPVRYTVIGGRSFIWEPGEYFDCPTCSSVLVTVEEDAEFRLTVLDSFGCPHEFRFRIHLRQPACDSSTIYIPNAFSPNQDGRNDVLYVRSKSITQMHLLIYDRWGERVFESFHPDDGWDGRFKGKPLGPDVFGYVLKALCVGGQEYQIKGNITLLK